MAYTNISVMRSNRFPLGCACTPMSGLGAGPARGAPTATYPLTTAVLNRIKLLQRRLGAAGVLDEPAVSLRSASVELSRLLTRGITTAGPEVATRIIYRYLLAATGTLVASSAALQIVEGQAQRGLPGAGAARDALLSVMLAAILKIEQIAGHLSAPPAVSGLGFFFLLSLPALAIMGGLLAGLLTLMPSVEEKAAMARRIASANCPPDLRAAGRCDWEREYREALEQINQSGIIAGLQNAANKAANIVTEPLQDVVRYVAIGGAVIAGGYLLFTFWPAISGFTARTRGALKAREAARVTQNRRRRRRRSGS